MTRGRLREPVFVLFSALLVQQAFGGIDIEGIVVGQQPTLVTSPGVAIPGTVKTPAVFKIRIRVNTNGKVLALCLGSQSDFDAGTCAQQIASASRDATGPFRDGLGIVDTPELFGKVLYIKNMTSGASASDIVQYTMTVE